jgi:hypothetical protein
VAALEITQNLLRGQQLCLLKLEIGVVMVKKTTDLDDQPTYQKRNRLKTHRNLTPKEKLKASKSLGQNGVKKSGAVKKRLAKSVRPKKPSAIKKPLSAAKLKKQLDIVFGRYIKMRDGRMEDRKWVITCITCHKDYVYRDIDGRRYTVIQAGHFMSRGLNATRFEERNVNGQCTYCNKWLAGDQYNHGLEIDKKYGEGTSTELYNLSRTEFKLKADWLQEKLDYYRAAIDSWEHLW